MANLEAIVDEIKDALNTIPNLHVFKLAEQVNTPAAQIEPHRVDFSGAMKRGTEQWDIVIRILVSAASQASAQLEVFKYFGQAKDIKDAVESHIPLKDGSVAHDVFVRTAEDFGIWDVNGVMYRGVQFKTEVYA